VSVGIEERAASSIVNDTRLTGQCPGKNDKEGFLMP